MAAMIVQTSTSIPAGAAAPAVKLAIPIDVGAPSVWSDAIAGAPEVGMIILNPSNGPGEGPDSTYARLVSEAQNKGISVLGYVYTRWADGNVSLQKAEGWIDSYFSWYHVDGIMLDEANSTCEASPLRFYQSLYTYVKEERGSAIVMLNPGEATGACYASVSDILLTFEGTYGKYFGSYASTDWTSHYPSSRFFHIVFGVPTAADMKAVVSAAKARGIGWVFVTDLDDSSGNPYSALPSYFGQETAYVGEFDNLVPASTSMLPAVLIIGATAASSLLVLAASRRKRALG